MKEFTYKTGDYTLYCKLEYSEQGDRYITIDMHQGNSGILVIPPYIEVEEKMIPVSSVGKKAFLGTTALRQVILPPTMHILDDWAFAQCEHLSQVIVQTDNEVTRNSSDAVEVCDFQIEFGKGVFDDCIHLEDICIGTEKRDTLSALLGAIPCRLKAEYLMRDSDIGSDHWYAKWDTSLSAFLDEDDTEGYTNMVLCGEEDIQRNMPEYIADKRRRKCALCLLRLLHTDCLEALFREKYEKYLLKHCKGSESEEAWEVILSDFGDRMEYYNLFATLGCITENNIDAMISDMGEQHAEAKAYLIDYKQTHFGGGDIFSAFQL